MVTPHSNPFFTSLTSSLNLFRLLIWPVWITTLSLRILRDNIVIHKGQISSLKRFKEEVSEVKAGFECGVMLDNYSDIKVGDIIETFEEVSTIRKL